MDCVPITKCIACGSDQLSPVLNLGVQPLANEYLNKEDQEQKKYPLAINHCKECYHVQLTHQVNPELMFRDYHYVSGVSTSLLEFFDDVVKLAYAKTDVTPRKVLDIGCNDASLLDAWRTFMPGIETCGVDPAENLHKITRGKSHNIRCGFFTGKEFGDTKFDVITCLNAFAHNPNPLQLLLNAKELMDDKSIFIASTSQSNMILNGEFDTIYHEHTSFFNTRSMSMLCERAGMVLVDVLKHPVHGSSYIFVIKKSGKVSKNVEAMIDQETIDGLYEFDTYTQFLVTAVNVAEDWRDLITMHRATGYKVVGYSAPAKGNTFMNYALQRPDYIFEDTTLKQGLFTPGMRVPIVRPDFSKLENEERVAWVILAWNMFSDIQKKIKMARPDKKDIFIRAFPKLEIVT